LKRKSSNHRAKKANVLEITHIDKFLGEADNNEYLMMKIVLIMGIFGACRCDELVKMSVDDVTYLSIDIPMTKTDKPRWFVIVKEGCSADPIALYQKYISLRPANIKHNRLFLRYANGKCTVQPVGINKIASIPSVIASYQKIEHPETYTGHSLRRSSTTLLAEGGADVINLKRHGGWRSSKTAEEYVADSNNSKIKIAKTIIGINRSSFNDLPGQLYFLF
jgi:integrase